jgi:hypothetical protein
MPNGNSGLRGLETLGVWTVALVMAGYLLVLTQSSYFSLLDLPNHLARATVMADLMFHHGAHFGGDFQYGFMAVPYVLGDIVFATLVALLGPDAAAIFWECLAFLSLPCALLFYLRVERVPAAGQLLGILFATYLAVDAFFFYGFIAFRLAVALTVVSVALAAKLRRQRSTPLLCLYAALVVAGYLTHLSALIFTTAAVGVTGVLRLWLRRTDIRTEAMLWIPILPVLAWHFFAVAPHYPSDLYDVHRATIGAKLARLPYTFHRFQSWRERYLQLTFLACLSLAGLRAVSAERAIRDWLSIPAVSDCLALVATFLALYFMLPTKNTYASALDVRALAPAALFVVAAAACLQPTNNSAHPPVTAAILLTTAFLSIANLTTIAWYFSSQTAWIDCYRQVVAAVPQGARVFPMAPQMRAPVRHAGSAVVTYRDGVIPNLFNDDNATMEYFRYVHRPYRPVGADRLDRRQFDWKQITCDYDFLLATKPFDPDGIGTETSMVAENSSAVLLRVAGHPCERRP